jgi:RNA polymerase-binding transcription factor DksA
MGRILESRGAGFARRALLARKKKLTALAACLRKGEGEGGDRKADPLDRAADVETRDVLDRLQTVQTRELAEIDAALKRVSVGTYGNCERCAAQVGPLRLQAVPETRRCMSCAASP